MIKLLLSNYIMINMKTITLKIKNLKAKLPEDFVQLISLTTVPILKNVDNLETLFNKLTKKDFHCQEYVNIATPTFDEYMSLLLNKDSLFYYIKDNHLNFDVGNKVDFWTKLFDILFPEKVILKYIPSVFNNTEHLK